MIIIISHHPFNVRSQGGIIFNCNYSWLIFSKGFPNPIIIAAMSMDKKSRFAGTINSSNNLKIFSFVINDSLISSFPFLMISLYPDFIESRNSLLPSIQPLSNSVTADTPNYFPYHYLRRTQQYISYPFLFD